MERCEACGLPETRANQLNKHHYRGKKNYPHDTMRVHTHTCHVLLQYLTNLFVQQGLEGHLTREHMASFYRRVSQIPVP